MVLRPFAMFLCLALFMAPQLSYSTAVITFCEEQGCTTPPVVEEEEVCHAVPPRHGLIEHRPTTVRDTATLPHWEERVPRVQEGEVPHPPPWS